MSIMIVDDTASQRFLVASLLKAAGYADLHQAASAQEAFDHLRSASHGVELILLDITMPDMDGLAACRRLKADPATQDIPVIMVTASTEEEDLQQAFDAGAMDYITKPPHKTDLLARVRSALKLKHEMDSRKAREAEVREVNRRLEDLITSLQEEQERSERLLLNVLPAPVAERLKREPGIIADYFPDVTVLFADIVDFTRLSATMPPTEVVAMLNGVFSAFDVLTERHRLEKIKTSGDAYMVVGGLPTPRADHAEAVAEMALDMLSALRGSVRATGSLLTLRIGLHSGPVVAGVIGTTKFSYDLWGDTVNIASRMEATGVNGRIHVSAETYARLTHRYTFAERGPVQVKGKGEMTTYFLVGKKA